MLLTATLLGLIAALGILDGRLLGVSMIDRPLVMCALTGLVCGNLHEGILIGPFAVSGHCFSTLSLRQTDPRLAKFLNTEFSIAHLCRFCNLFYKKILR